MRSSRRTLLASVAAGVTSLAGCAGLSLGQSGESGGDGDDRTGTPSGTPTATATPTPTPEPTDTPTPDPRRNVVEPSFPSSFPIEGRVVVPRDGYHAYHLFVPDSGVRMSYTFRAVKQEDFDVFGFDPDGFATYVDHVIEGAEEAPDPIADITEEDTNGLLKRLAVRFDPGEYYLVLDHTDFGSAANRRGVAGDVELRVELELL